MADFLITTQTVRFGDDTTAVAQPNGEDKNSPIRGNRWYNSSGILGHGTSEKDTSRSQGKPDKGTGPSKTAPKEEIWNLSRHFEFSRRNGQYFGCTSYNSPHIQRPPPQGTTAPFRTSLNSHAYVDLNGPPAQLSPARHPHSQPYNLPHQPTSPTDGLSSNQLDPTATSCLQRLGVTERHRLFAQQQQQYHSPLYNYQLRRPYTSNAYIYPPQQNSSITRQMPASPYTSRTPYELKDVVELSRYGSLFIQQKLPTANSEEKYQIFNKIQPNALQLMTDVFGNHIIQKFFQYGDQVQKQILVRQMKNHVYKLSVHIYGCHVVQKALEHVLADQQTELLKELQHDILKCVKDQNGNRVILKAIKCVPTEHIQFIIEVFKGEIHTLATHRYGCCVVQRMLEYFTERDLASVLEELHLSAQTLITDQYGNYVMQHVIEHGKPEDRAKIIELVTEQLLTLSKQKFASNVVEKTIQFGSDKQRQVIVAKLTAKPSDGSSPLQLMMKDQYGNYVVQKLLTQLKGAERGRFVEDMRLHLKDLKKYNCGKQIMAIEKLISSDIQTTSCRT